MDMTEFFSFNMLVVRQADITVEKRPLLISDKRAGTIRVKGIKQSESKGAG